MSLSRNVTGREFQRHGPATEKLLSPRRVRVLLVPHVKTSADRSDRRPMSVKIWQSSARYCGSWPCDALYTSTASLKSMRCRTGNQCSSLRTGVICSRLPVHTHITVGRKNFNLACRIQYRVGLSSVNSNFRKHCPISVILGTNITSKNKAVNSWFIF